MSDVILDAAFLKKIERLSLISRRAFAGQMKGEKRSVKRGASVEFADYREYQQGDDLRYVDWNTAARLDKLFIKLFIEEEDLFLSLLIDTSKSMGFGSPAKLTYAARTAAALGYIGLTNYDRVSAITFSSNIHTSLPAHRGRGAVPPLFHYLNQLKADGETSFQAALKSYAMRVKHRGVAVVLSDFLDPNWKDGLSSLLARGFQLVLIHILDEKEITPALTGDLRILDCETGLSKEMSVSPALLGRYEVAFNRFCNDIESFAHRYGVDYFRVSTQYAFDDLILKYLREGGVVR